MGPKQDSEQVDRGSDQISGRSNRNITRCFISKRSFCFRPGMQPFCHRCCAGLQLEQVARGLLLQFQMVREMEQHFDIYRMSQKFLPIT